MAQPDWVNPLDATHAHQEGGRWNAPGTHAAIYLNTDLDTARANVRHKFRGLPYGPEDLNPADAPHLVLVDVPEGTAADAASDEGLSELGLPMSYPLHPNGQEVAWEECWPIGAAVFAEGLDGIACRSAAAGGNEELAYFVRDRELRLAARREFANWYWPS